MMRAPTVLAAVCALAVLSDSSNAGAQFVTGDVYYTTAEGDIYDVSGGGDFGATAAFAQTAYSAGQLAWSRDLETMYLAIFAEDRVVAIDSTGVVTEFATNIAGPTGLLMTSDGALLVASNTDGEIFDITAGGNVNRLPPLVTGLMLPRHIVQLPDGRVMVADQGANAVYDIRYPSGGAVGTPFAQGFVTVHSLAVAADGTLFAAREDGDMSAVYDITAGGAPSVTPYAVGQPFFTVAATSDGGLLASELLGTEIWDITGGGDFGAVTPWAVGLPAGESPLGVVPSPVCGSGVQAAGEECDDGNDSNEDECLDDCTAATCGDAFVWDGVEDCDDGNNDDGDGCSADCVEEGSEGGDGDGGCGCSLRRGGAGSSALLLFLVVVGVLGRRRSRRR